MRSTEPVSGSTEVLHESTEPLYGSTEPLYGSTDRLNRRTCRLNNRRSRLTNQTSRFDHRTDRLNKSAGHLTRCRNCLNQFPAVNQRNPSAAACGANSEQATIYRETPHAEETDKMKPANLAVVNQVRGWPDPSGGRDHLFRQPHFCIADGLKIVEE